VSIYKVTCNQNVTLYEVPSHTMHSHNIEHGDGKVV